jgi:hypothetical protein
MKVKLTCRGAVAPNVVLGLVIFLCTPSLYCTTGFVLIPDNRIFDYCPTFGQFQQQHDTCTVRRYPHPFLVLLELKNDSNANDENYEGDDDAGDENINMMEQVLMRQETLDVEKVREQLEQDNMRKLLSRKPIKLPYEAARRWVQANLGPNTKEEFFDLVANGNLRTPYIPKNPEGYYTSTREWISWDHFLKGLFDNEKPSNIRPASGIFD